MIKLLPISNENLDELLPIARTTFKAAFEEQNKPEDFRLYMQQAFNKEFILKQLQHPDMHFYFVKRDTLTLGYIKLNENDAQNEHFESKSLELERFYIQSKYQGQQIGQSVLKKIIEIAKNKGVAFLWLGVWEKNRGAIRFYKRHGFRKFGSHPYVLGNDKQTDYLMKIDLNPPLLSKQG